MARPRGAKQRSEVVRERLAAEYPDAECALIHDDAFQLLAATIMSAQTTDENVNKVTPKLFARYPTARDLAHADPADVERIIHSTGFFRSKAKNIIGMARALDDDFDGEVPTELEDLVKLPGSGARPATWCGRSPSTSPASRSTRTSGGSRAGSSSPTRPIR